MRCESCAAVAQLVRMHVQLALQQMRAAPYVCEASSSSTHTPVAVLLLPSGICVSALLGPGCTMQNYMLERRHSWGCSMVQPYSIPHHVPDSEMQDQASGGVLPNRKADKKQAGCKTLCRTSNDASQHGPGFHVRLAVLAVLSDARLSLHGLLRFCR